MILNNIRKKGVDITRSVFTGGETVVDYLEAFNVDLFLTTSIDDLHSALSTLMPVQLLF